MPDRAIAPARWARGALIALLAIVALWAVVRHGLASASYDRQPAIALKAVANDARALEAAAEKRIAKGQDPAARSAAAQLARAALERDATRVKAARTLGLVALIERDDRKGQALIDYASALSRRDLPVQLALIEQAVQRDDIEGALRHYDIALRTGRSAPRVLFPVLREAIADPALTAPMARITQANPLWVRGFAYDLLDNGSDATALARVLMRVPSAPLAREDELRRSLLGRLTREERYAAARRYHQSLFPQARDALLLDPTFTEAAMLPPFGWALADSPDVGAQRAASGGLDFFGDPEQAGVVASQLLTLPPGRFALLSSGSGDDARWTIECAGSDRQIANLRATGANAGGVFMVVPACGAQWLRLNVPASNTERGSEGRVARVMLVRR